MIFFFQFLLLYSSSKLSRKTVWVLIMVMHPVSHYRTFAHCVLLVIEVVANGANDRKSEVRIFLLLASSALKGYDYGR